MVRSREALKFWWAPTISLERLQVERSRQSSQCDKLVTVDICVQHDGREAPRRADLSVAADLLLLMT